MLTLSVGESAGNKAGWKASDHTVVAQSHGNRKIHKVRRMHEL